MTDDHGTDPEPGVCQYPVRGYPWTDHPRADLRDRAWRRIRETAEYGLKFSKLVIELHGPEAIEESNYDYKHLRAFVRDLDLAGYVHIERIGPQERESDRPLWVFPTATRDGSVLDTVSGVSEHRADSQTSGGESVATANAAARLGCRRTLDTAEEWGILVGALGAKRLGEERSGDRQATRFNSVYRAAKSGERVSTAFAAARSLQYSPGVVVTLPTDPSRFDSIRAATDTLIGDVKLLRRKLGTPPGVTVIEPTERGVGHAHVPLFDVTEEALPSDHELHNYWWEARKRGQQVDVQPIELDGESWRWAKQPPADAAGRPPDSYVRKDVEALPRVARLDAKDVLAVATAYRDRGETVFNADTHEDIDTAVSDETGVDAAAVRRAAWYFGAELKAATRPSPQLRDAVESDEQRGGGA